MVSVDFVPGACKMGQASLVVYEPCRSCPHVFVGDLCGQTAAGGSSRPFRGALLARVVLSTRYDVRVAGLW